MFCQQLRVSNTGSARTALILKASEEDVDEPSFVGDITLLNFMVLNRAHCSDLLVHNLVTFSKSAISFVWHDVFLPSLAKCLPVIALLVSKYLQIQCLIIFSRIFSGKVKLIGL